MQEGEQVGVLTDAVDLNLICPALNHNLVAINLCH